MLTKKERVEMLATYDRDPAKALMVAIRAVTGRVHGRLSDMIHASHLPLDVKHAICDGDVAACDTLVGNLNEFAGEQFVAAVSPL